MSKEKMIYALLDDLNIAYDTLEHAPISSVRDTDIVLPGQQVKNLCLKTKKARKFYLVILKDEKSAHIKKLEETLGEKRLSFANEEELERLLHVEPGVVTPFGLLYDTEHHIQVIIDEEVDPNLTVGFHPFNNTKTLNIAYSDFIRFLEYVGHPAIRLEC